MENSQVHGGGRLIQIDIYGNEVPAIVGVKDPDSVRQYPMTARTITLIDSAALKTGRPKAEVVATAIELYATMISILPPDVVEIIRNGQIRDLFAQSI